MDAFGFMYLPADALSIQYPVTSLVKKLSNSSLVMLSKISIIVRCLSEYLLSSTGFPASLSCCRINSSFHHSALLVIVSSFFFSLSNSSFISAAVFLSGASGTPISYPYCASKLNGSKLVLADSVSSTSSLAVSLVLTLVADGISPLPVILMSKKSL